MTGQRQLLFCSNMFSQLIVSLCFPSSFVSTLEGMPWATRDAHTPYRCTPHTPLGVLGQGTYHSGMSKSFGDSANPNPMVFSQWTADEQPQASTGAAGGRSIDGLHINKTIMLDDASQSKS
jgi:hypothetical protein